jgi:hypothetical protein
LVVDLPAESDKRIVNWKLPEIVGVPPIWLPFKFSPGGREPPETDQAYGTCPPVAASVCVYGLPLTPSGRELVLIVRAGTGALMTTVQFEIADAEL